MTNPALLKPILIIGGSIFLGIIGFIIYMFSQGKKGFKFILYSRDGQNANIIEGYVKVDPENKNKKVFCFKNYSSELTIKAPTLFIKGVPHRELTFSDDGDLIYLEGKEIDRDKNLKRCLSPEEKQIALFRMKENNRRYENPMSKNQAILMGAMLILTLLLLIGIIYVTITYVKTIKNASELARELKVISRNILDATTGLKLISEQQTLIMSSLNGYDNIVRQVS